MHGHAGGSGLGIARPERRHDRLVLHRAALDGARRLGGDAAIFHPQLVEALRHGLEKGIAAQTIEGAVELLVEQPEAQGIAHQLEAARHHLLEPGQDARLGRGRGRADQPGLDQKARLVQRHEVGLVERDHELQRRHQPADGEIGDVAAPALARLDHTQDGKPAQRLADHRPAHLERLGQLGLARQPVARAHIARADQVDDLRDHPLGRGFAPQERRDAERACLIVLAQGPLAIPRIPATAAARLPCYAAARNLSTEHLDHLKT